MKGGAMFARLSEQTLLTGAFVAAPILYIGGLALGRWLKRQHRVQLGMMFHLFCLFAALYVPLAALRVGHPPAAESWQDRGLRAYVSVLILLGIIFVLALVKRFLFQRWFSRTHDSEAPKLLQQVFSAAAFTVALMLVLNLRHGQQVDTFIAGSGILAVVLGFAMQETLANIISGIALQISKPFKVGDWLIVEKHRAEVIEMNWRSTRLRTNDDIYLDLPNKSVTSGTITNLSYPTKAHAQRIRVRFEQRVPPNTVREVLRHAAEHASGVLRHPPVKVFLVEFMDLAAIYEIKYYLDEAGRFNDIEDAIRTNIWYEAQRAKLVIPPPVQTLQINRDSPQRASRMEPVDVFARQELFACLNEEQRQQLCANARIQRFGRKEEIIHQGDEGCSMFLLLNGTADVMVHANGRDLRVAELHTGDAFGEMCLLTGENRSASIVARTDCEVWEIDRSVLAPILKENAELGRQLSELLAQRKVETEGLIAAQTPPQEVAQVKREYANGFFRRISSLFEI